MKIKAALLGRVDYAQALDIQQKLVLLRQSNEVEDTLLLLEHPPVITLGRRGAYSNILLPQNELEAAGVGVFEVNRGGDVTYHGPGQIVGYPVMDLRNYGRDIKNFVWRIEEIFIRLLRDEFNLEAHRDKNKYTGVWIENEKITAIGIAVKHWVSMHGFAFNVNTQLEHFKWIVPCGLADRGVTSLERQLGCSQDITRLNELVLRYFCEVFNVEFTYVDIVREVRSCRNVNPIG